MDELTIGEKTYVSSKRAAKITGYAKDYVGQLCREGRVEAKLVGRNWYVLEASIMEHRFGTAPVEDSSTRPPAEEPVVAIADAVWEKPRYEAEVPVMVPSLIKPETPVPAEEPRRVVAEMQSAWQEWFATQQAAPKALESDDSDFDGHLLPVVEYPAAVEAAPAPEPVVLHAIETPNVEVATATEVPVALHRSYDEIQVPVSVEDGGNYEDLRHDNRGEVRDVHTADSSNLVLKSLFVGVAFVAVCVALVGTGVVGDLAAGSVAGSNSATTGFVQLLSGSTEYKSIK